MATTYTPIPVATVETTVHIGPHLISAVTNEDRISLDRPVSIPTSQLYFWTRRWQEAEHEALAELERGEGREFGSGREAVEWLHSPWQ